MVEGRSSSNFERTGTKDALMASRLSTRWLNYVLRTGEGFVDLWSDIFGSGRRDLLFIVGKGFDPRMCLAAKILVGLGGPGLRHCALVGYDEGSMSASHIHDKLVAANVETLTKLFSNHGSLDERHIRMWSDDGRRRVGSRGATEVFNSVDELTHYTDVVLDISALPRSLYMPMLAKLLYLIDRTEGKPPNLHVVTADNPILDGAINAEGISDDASYLHGFESGIEQESTAYIPKVWMPILGEGKAVHFEKIHDLVAPDEIAPIVPFPCADPRRTDNLILEYRQLLFDRARIEPANFIYIPEQNPFHVYRAIVEAVQHYSDALQTLGGCKVIISALASKLLSLGALLAAYDLKSSGYCVGIAHVPASGYSITTSAGEQPRTHSLFEVWIAGEPYDLC